MLLVDELTTSMLNVWPFDGMERQKLTSNENL